MERSDAQDHSWETLAYLAGLAFVFLGITSSVIYLGCAFLAFGAGYAKRRKALGYGVAAFGLLFLFITFGYNVGKDMARRDSALAERSADGR